MGVNRKDFTTLKWKVRRQQREIKELREDLEAQNRKCDEQTRRLQDMIDKYFKRSIRVK